MKRWKPIQWLMGVAAGISSGCYRAGRWDAQLRYLSHDRRSVALSGSVKARSLGWCLWSPLGNVVVPGARVARRSVALVSAQDHGVDHVDAGGESCPEQGRQEKAANDGANGVGLEEAWFGASASAAISEAFES